MSNIEISVCSTRVKKTVNVYDACLQQLLCNFQRLDMYVIYIRLSTTSKLSLQEPKFDSFVVVLFFTFCIRNKQMSFANTPLFFYSPLSTANMYFYKDFILHKGNKCPSMSMIDVGYKLLEKISNKNIKTMKWT